jgi:hypothetical protein
MAVRRICNSSGVLQLLGSAQRLPVPWERSTAPLSCGLAGGFQIMSMPKPINHRAKSVGKSLHDPQGLPLSTRKLHGRPHREKA